MPGHGNIRNIAPAPKDEKRCVIVDLSVLIGGKAGFGIDKAGLVIASGLNRLGYHIYVYRDYPSLIRGGHAFSVIRASNEKIASHRENIDILLALNQETLDLHKEKLSGRSVIIYDSDAVKKESLPAGVRSSGIALTGILKEESAPEITRNSCMIGSLFRSVGISRAVLEECIRRNITSDVDINLKVALRCHDETSEFIKLEPTGRTPLSLLTGNEAIGLGLIRGGLKAYISYPMTPTSPILHFLAGLSEDFKIKVIHPESEIAVILMALGFSYCGEKAAVGTSGGGFCLMTEGLSLSGMAELPIVIILGQRPGPSTGLPTYSAQTELDFAIAAGQGEFTRFVAAPGDAEEAFYWAHAALNFSSKYRIPSILLTDKNMGEGTYSFDINMVKGLKIEEGLPADRNKIMKVNSYEHDENGITTEDPAMTVAMADKRLAKEKYLKDELRDYEVVKVCGNTKSEKAILCWGSNKGVSVEAASKLGLKVIQVIVLSPFPKERVAEALGGVKKLLAVENNAKGQLAGLMRKNGFKIDREILKYDGRPFTADELERSLNKVMGQ